MYAVIKDDRANTASFAIGWDVESVLDMFQKKEQGVIPCLF